MIEKIESFGDPKEFCVRIAWSEDSTPVAERPSVHGWSMGQLEIVAGGKSLTAHSTEQGSQDSIEWYLGPFLHWLAENWVDLLYEHYHWIGAKAESAAMLCEKSFASWVEKQDDQGDALDEYFNKLQEWHQHHCISSAAEGGLFPEIYLRRFRDNIEVSWTGRTSIYAPPDFIFQADAGVANCNFSAVADSLWEVLQWAVHSPPKLEEQSHKEDWQLLCQEVGHIPGAFKNLYYFPVMESIESESGNVAVREPKPEPPDPS